MLGADSTFSQAPTHPSNPPYVISLKFFITVIKINNNNKKKEHFTQANKNMAVKLWFWSKF